MNQEPEIEKSEETLVITCCGCGKALDEFSGWQGNPDYYQETRFVHHCRDCMQGYFEDIAKKTSPHMALFYCCVAYNIPFLPDCISGADGTPDTWKEYLDNVRRRGAKDDNDEPLCFLDGMTDILKIFGESGLSSGEFAKNIAAEKNFHSKVPGTKMQRKNWGTIDGYTNEDYKELDRLYQIQSKPLEGSIDMEMEFNLREICKLLLKYSRFIREGKTLDAQRTMSIIETIKSSNLLRKKDEKPAEAVKIDTLMDQLEKHHMAKGGKLLSREETLKVLQGSRPHYPHSFDVVDQILLLITNTMRKNDGLGELASLPEEMRFTPAPGEFNPKESDKERQRREALGLVKIEK